MKFRTLAVLSSLIMSSIFLGAEKSQAQITVPGKLVCNSYVTSIEVIRVPLDVVNPARVAGQESIKFSSGKSYYILPVQVRRGDLTTSIETEPNTMITLLTASYMNKKNICYLVRSAGKDMDELAAVRFE